MTIVVVLLLFALIFARLPIGMSMLIAAFVGLASISGLQPAISIASHTIYATGTNYSLAALPLYVLLGNLINHAGFGEQLYKASNSFIGHYRGGLAMGTILSCGGLSAVSGSSLATAATMSKIAMPSMRALGYSDRLAASSVAAGGTLGILIPPSIVLVLYGILTETDIGLLFIAGVLPGLARHRLLRRRRLFHHSFLSGAGAAWAPAHTAGTLVVPAKGVARGPPLHRGSLAASIWVCSRRRKRRPLACSLR